MVNEQMKRIRQMVMSDPSAILLLKPAIVDDRLWKLAIEQDPGLYRYNEHPSDELTAFAVELDGTNLKYAFTNPNVTVTKKLVFSAIQSYPPIIFDIPRDVRTNEMLEFAFDQDPTLIKYFDSVRRSYLDRKIAADPTFIRFLENPSEEQIYAAIEYDPNFCAYVKNFTPRIKELIQVLYPDIINMIPGLSNQIQDL